MRTILLAAVAAIAAGTIAAAQPAPPEYPDRAGWMQAHAAEFAQMRQRRGDDIALLIGLRPDQRPAFDAMLAAMEPPHRDWGKDRHGPDGAKDEDLGARLDRMNATIDAHSAAAKAKLAQLKSFYASLSSDQRRRFDALDRLRHDHMGHMGDHEHGMMPPSPPMG